MIFAHFNCAELSIHVAVALTGPVIPILHDPEGWQAVQRFGRTSFTEYQGAQQLEVQVPLIFDGKRDQKSQEPYIDILENMATYQKDKHRTPLITWDTGGRAPHDMTNDPHIQWVIQSLDFSGGYMLDNFLQYRVRQVAQANLWQYSQDAIFAEKLHPPMKNIPKTYRIKKNDTLQKIAAFFYGDQARWHDIATLNKIRDPLHLKVGRRIKLPKV